jgi:hypothetical protein
MMFSRHGRSTGAACALLVGDNEAAGVSRPRKQTGDELGREDDAWAAAASV